jgi:DNA-binding IscR family transcriptional regulator
MNNATTVRISENAMRVLRILQSRDEEGAVVTVRHLAQSLGISAPHIVDACDELEHVHLVEWYPGRDTTPGGYALTRGGREAVSPAACRR